MESLPIGIDIGGTKMLAIALDRDAPDHVVTTRLVPTPATPEEVISSIIEVARGIAQDVGGIASLGIGLPGLVDSEGILRSAPNLQHMVDVPVRDRVAHALGVDVLIDNDATLALNAEMQLGVARGVDDVVMVTLGTGIGGAVALDGNIRRGVHGFAGEPGHMRVDPNGPLCVCGRVGCWERYASGSGVVWLARQHGLVGAETITGEQLVELGRAGDGAALEVWSQFARWLAIGLADIADILDPEMMVIGGGLVDATDLYLDEARSVFATEVLGGPARGRTRLEPATCGPRSGAIGAALLH